MTVQIQGWGTALPQYSVSQETAAHLAVDLWGKGLDLTSVLPVLFRRSSVQTRYSVVLESGTTADRAQQSFFQRAEVPTDLGPSTAARMQVYEQESTTLAERACEAAIEDARIDRCEIGHLITVSCTGFSAPGVDLCLIKSLQLKADVSRTHIGFMGCHGALNGLRVARAIAAQYPGKRVLLCCVELCSLHQQYTRNTQQLVANALFSDGAAALVIGAQEETAERWTLRAHGSCVLPETTEMMSWRIGDHGFEMSLSPEVPGVIQGSLRPWLTKWLGEQNLTLEEIGSWGIHPGGPRILTACADALGFDRSYLKPSQDVLAAFGNMSSPTILFILDRLRRAEVQRPCVALAFGPGLSIEAALLS